MKLLRAFITDETAATTVEYAVMLAMILMTVIVAIGAFGANQNSYWGNIDTEMENHGF